jgi:hypothetical protein
MEKSKKHTLTWAFSWNRARVGNEPSQAELGSVWLA